VLFKGISINIGAIYLLEYSPSIVSIAFLDSMIELRYVFYSSQTLIKIQYCLIRTGTFCMY
ncbi:hypothetical protein, partial [Staphylococcus succinus]|uniref:hypothetical protein n=1 Tax=Staphylococcus succinus TaxID=61015 RepID=UPI001C712F81